MATLAGSPTRPLQATKRKIAVKVKATVRFVCMVGGLDSPNRPTREARGAGLASLAARHMRRHAHATVHPLAPRGARAREEKCELPFTYRAIDWFRRTVPYVDDIGARSSAASEGPDGAPTNCLLFEADRPRATGPTWRTVGGMVAPFRTGPAIFRWPRWPVRARMRRVPRGGQGRPRASRARLETGAEWPESRRETSFSSGRRSEKKQCYENRQQRGRFAGEQSARRIEPAAGAPGQSRMPSVRPLAEATREPAGPTSPTTLPQAAAKSTWTRCSR